MTFRGKALISCGVALIREMHLFHCGTPKVQCLLEEIEYIFVNFMTCKYGKYECCQRCFSRNFQKNFRIAFSKNAAGNTLPLCDYSLKISKTAFNP